LKIFKLNFLKL